MILYITRKERVSVFDEISQDTIVQKIIAPINLSNFAVTELRKYSNINYLIIDRYAIDDKDEDFVEAIKSITIMSSVNIVVLYETQNKADTLIHNLREVGVFKIITDLCEVSNTFKGSGYVKENVVERVEEIKADVKEKESTKGNAFTLNKDKGLEKNISKPFFNIKVNDYESHNEEQYRFDETNITIGVVGSTRRVGVTTISFMLAEYIEKVGGSCCYVEFNSNNHLVFYAEHNDFKKADEMYINNGVDYYKDTNIKYEYNFIIYDFGSVCESDLRNLVQCDVVVLCGAVNEVYEIEDFCNSKSIIGLDSCFLMTTNDIKSDFKNLVDERLGKEIDIVDKNNSIENEKIFKSIVQNYITETDKRF